MRPLILVSNDDGILAPGIAALADALRELGEVIVVAPDGERSATSHAITLHSSLRAREVRAGWYAVTGTPVDSVYFGALHICPRIPDLVITGINDGYNLGTDTFYSGTVGAAREGRLRGASALAVSIAAHCDPTAAGALALSTAQLLLARHRLGERHLLNLNVPPQAKAGPVPLKVCRLGHRRYRDTVEERKDLMGRPYYWIGGPPSDADDDASLDTQVVTRGEASLTPLSIDATADSVLAWEDHVAHGART